MKVYMLKVLKQKNKRRIKIKKNQFLNYRKKHKKFNSKMNKKI